MKIKSNQNCEEGERQFLNDKATYRHFAMGFDTSKN